MFDNKWNALIGECFIIQEYIILVQFFLLQNIMILAF